MHNLQDAGLPQGAVQGQNSWRRTGYGGPCPPGGRHRYFFLYALDTTLALGPDATKKALLAAMEGHVRAQVPRAVGCFAPSARGI